MNSRLEDKIRDYLACNLDLLESGLTLLKAEYVLSNPVGAGGRIDIVAKDRFGNVLVIEIKRSDQAARQALNEIFKYTALFRRDQGLDETHVRLFVVSTEWHELLLPLSEYAETAAYTVNAFSIVALPDGTVTSAVGVALAPRAEAIELSRIQGGYLFEKPDARNQAVSLLSAAVRRVGIQDFVIFQCDQNGTNPMEVYPYALYLCYSSPFRTSTKEDIARLKASLEWDDELDEPEENFLCAVNSGPENLCDTFEIGYPEKLVSLQESWSISVLTREGRLGRTNSLLSDEDVVRLAKKLEGGSHCHFEKICSPRFKAAWDRMRSDLLLALKGNGHWEQALPALLNRVETETPHAAVSISLYNPFNLPISLYYVAWRDDYSRCPHLELCIEDEVKGELWLIVSRFAWDGRVISNTPENLVEEVYGGFEMWCASNFEFEDAALAAHHLSTPIVEIRFSKQGEPSAYAVALESDQLILKPLAKESLPSLEGFGSANREYLTALKAYLEKNSVGLPGSKLGL